MEHLVQNKRNSGLSPISPADKNESNQFVDEISFPFIPCQYTKHKKFGPQTVISHFTFDASTNNYILFCNTCLKDIEKKNQRIHYHDIEEFVENFLRKLTPGQLECPEPSPQLVKAYEMKQNHVMSFKKQIDKEVQTVVQTFDDIIQEVTKTITERRDHIIKCFNSVNDIFSQSYDLFNYKYERLFKSNDRLSQLKETNELKINNDLQEVSSAVEYQALLKDLKELDDLCQELMNRERKKDELVNFSETLQNLYQVLPPIPFNRKTLTETCIANVQQAFNQSITQCEFKQNHTIQKITSGLTSYSENENNAYSESLIKTIEMSKQFWNKVHDEVVEKLQEAKRPEIIEDIYPTETPMGEYENDEEDQILSVSINKVIDLEKINNPEITHLEIVSNEMDDELAKALGRVVSEIKNLISVTFDFCGGGNHITDQGALALIKSIKRHSGINNLLIDFSEGQNCVTNDTMKLLAETLVELPKLDMLFINVCCGQNSVTDQGAIFLGEALQYLSQLTNLRLNFCGGKNVITDPGAIALCQPIGNMKKLNYLLLKLCCGRNKLTDKGHLAMATAIVNMQELIGLTLATSGEKANDEGAFLISKSLEGLNNLQALTLGFYENSMTDKAAEFISDSLRKLPNLSSLRLNVCGGRKMITDAGIGYISKAIAELQNLTAITLSFYDNMLTDVGIAEIAKGVSDLKNLNTIALNLHGASVTDTGAYSLAEFVRKSPHLNSLAFIFSGGANKVTDNGVNVLCSAVRDLILLEYLTLDFSDNQLTDTGANFISQSLRELDNIGELTLCFDGNQISEVGVNQLGSTIAELKNLRSIMLFFANNPINKGTWEKLTSMMRNALPNSDISITWDNNYKPENI